jgi:hypothetical protein
MAHVDLDAILEGEQGFPFTFTLGGQDWTLPPQMDMKALILMGRQEGDPDIYGAMEILMGSDQFARFLRATGRLTSQRFEALMKAYARHQGADDMGESLASTSSSPDTGTPSKLTLPGITPSISGETSARAS